MKSQNFLAWSSPQTLLVSPTEEDEVTSVVQRQSKGTSGPWDQPLERDLKQRLFSLLSFQSQAMTLEETDGPSLLTHGSMAGVATKTAPSNRNFPYIWRNGLLQDFPLQRKRAMSYC